MTNTNNDAQVVLGKDLQIGDRILRFRSLGMATWGDWSPFDARIVKIFPVGSVYAEWRHGIGAVREFGALEPYEWEIERRTSAAGVVNQPTVPTVPGGPELKHEAVKIQLTPSGKVEVVTENGNFQLGMSVEECFNRYVQAVQSETKSHDVHRDRYSVNGAQRGYSDPYVIGDMGRRLTCLQVKVAQDNGAGE